MHLFRMYICFEGSEWSNLNYIAFNWFLSSSTVARWAIEMIHYCDMCIWCAPGRSHAPGSVMRMIHLVVGLCSTLWLVVLVDSWDLTILLLELAIGSLSFLSLSLSLSLSVCGLRLWSRWLASNEVSTEPEEIPQLLVASSLRKLWGFDQLRLCECVWLPIEGLCLLGEWREVQYAHIMYILWLLLIHTGGNEIGN